MKLVTVLFIALLACADLLAQVSVSGSLSGNVADNNKSAVSCASVRIVNRQTNAELSTLTNESGLYAFPLLAPGKYALIVEQSGFQRTTVENVEITVNEAATANVVLTVGEITATVTVESGASIVQ